MHVLTRGLLVLTLLAATLLTPLPWLPLVLLAALALYPLTGTELTAGDLLPLATLAGLVVAFNVLALPLVHRLGGWSLTWDPWTVGVATALRLATALATATWFQRTTEAREVLPLIHRLPRLTILLVGALRFAPELQRDAQRIRDAQRARGYAPRRGPLAALDALPLAVPLLVRSLRRGATADAALQAAGVPRDRIPWGGAAVLTGLAVAARLAFAWAPNVTPMYLVVLLAGLVLGPLAGAVVGAASMTLTGLLLSGLHPVVLVNAPAMALLGLAGGALRPLVPPRGERGRSVLLAGFAGLLGVTSIVAFSLLSDTLSWVLFYGLAEGLWSPTVWGSLVALGLAFNAVPALVNGVLFATVTPAAVHAVERAGLLRA